MSLNYKILKAEVDEKLTFGKKTVILYPSKLKKINLKRDCQIISPKFFKIWILAEMYN